MRKGKGSGDMRINKVHCLFEQSGTFKKEFMKLGIPAEDYDILNDFGETDHIIDLFGEIDKAYEGKPSLFDSIGDCDLVFAFFPCTRFEARVPLLSRCDASQMKNWTDAKRIDYSMRMQEEVCKLYTLICKLFQICLRGGWRMIVENPRSNPHFLTMYFPIKPKVIDTDRSKEGDHYSKPTQYWFVNCEPEQNVTIEPIEDVEHHTSKLAHLMDGDMSRQVKRSMIHPQYARRFIINHIISVDGGVWI